MENSPLDFNSDSRILGDGAKTEEKSNFLNYFLTIVKQRKFILSTFFVVIFSVAILSLFLPNWYTAKTSVLPPEKEMLQYSTSPLGGLSSILGGMALPLLATPSDVMASILKSRTVAEAVIEKEGLKNYYKQKTPEKTLRETWSHLKAWAGEEGLVYLTFEDKNRNRAASVANSFIEELDKVNRETQVSKAKSRRLFLQERLDQTEAKMKKADENLKDYKKAKKLASLDEQIKAAVELAAKTKANLDSIEVELYVVGKMNPSSLDAKELKWRKEELSKKLKGFDSTFVYIAGISYDFANLYREFAIHSRVYDLLTQEFEKTKIEEGKDTPSLQVLDKAVPPEKKSRPKRTYLVAFAGSITLLASIFWVFLKEYLANFRRKNPQEFNKLELIYRGISKDVVDLRRNLLRFRKTRV